MEKVTDFFGSMVFDDRVMKATLSEKVYKSLKRTIDRGTPLDISVANEVAAAMKDWAISKGATHYTHWFQPMTGVTAFPVHGVSTKPIFSEQTRNTVAVRCGRWVPAGTSTMKLLWLLPNGLMF